jgi:hypothetical protein
MRIITEEQLTAISLSMRTEFERRACAVLSREINLPESELRQVIHAQSDKIANCNIDAEAAKMQFLRLSFEYPALRAETPPEPLNGILSSVDDENTKMENLINHLNTDDYGV